MLGKINLERFFSYILMIFLLLMIVDFIHKNIPRIELKTGKIPTCYFRKIKLIFNNYFDNETSGDLVIYRKLGRIYIKNCNTSLELRFKTNCNNFYLFENESDDKILNNTFYSSVEPGDCDYLIFDCNGIFWVYIESKNKSACVGDICELECPGIPIEVEYENFRNVIFEVGYS